MLRLTTLVFVLAACASKPAPPPAQPAPTPTEPTPTETQTTPAEPRNPRDPCANHPCPEGQVCTAPADAPTCVPAKK